MTDDELMQEYIDSIIIQNDDDNEGEYIEDDPDE